MHALFASYTPRGPTHSLPFLPSSPYLCVVILRAPVVPVHVEVGRLNCGCGKELIIKFKLHASTSALLGRPGDLDVVGVVSHRARLLVETLHAVAILKLPLALALWLVVVETPTELSSVGVQPPALHHLALRKVANVLLSSALEHVSSFSILLSARPVARIDVVVCVGHHTLAVAPVVLPVTVVDANTWVDLLSDAALDTIGPLAVVRGLDLVLLLALFDRHCLCNVLVNSSAVSQLQIGW